MSWRDQRKVVRFWHRLSLTMKSRFDFLSLSICSTEAVVAIRAIVKAFIMYKTYLWLARNEGMDPYSRHLHHSSFPATERQGKASEYISSRFQVRNLRAVQV